MSANYCTVEDAKKYITLGRNVTADAGLLLQLVNATTAAFNSKLNRSLLAADYTEIRDGTGTSTLVLANYPIISVTSVSLGIPGSYSALRATTDYIASRTAIRILTGANFPRGIANVQVIYRAGFTTTPDDIRDAAAETVALKYRKLERLGQLSKTLAGETVTFDTSDISKSVENVIFNYRRTVQLTSQGPT